MTDNLGTGSMEVKTWYREGCYLGEPVFVSSPKAKVEDVGLIFSVVLDGSEEKSFLLILDAVHGDRLREQKFPIHSPSAFRDSSSRMINARVEIEPLIHLNRRPGY